MPGIARLSNDRTQNLTRLAKSHLDGMAGGTIVDLGAGNGELLEAFGADSSVRWIGVDIDEEAMAAARIRYPGREFLAASADALPLASESVDVVVASTLFSSLPSRRFEHEVAMEIDRVTRRGGIVAWFDLRYGNPWNEAVHGISEQRVAELFPGWQTGLRSTGVLPPLARRLGRGTSVLYPILQAIRPLRSHLVGWVQKP